MPEKQDLLIPGTLYVARALLPRTQENVLEGMSGIGTKRTKGRGRCDRLLTQRRRPAVGLNV